MLQPRLILVSLSAAVLSACVVAPYPARQVVYAPAPAPMVAPAPVEGQVIVDVAPPAPYVEAVPVMPFVGAIWIGGYWGWNGGRHVWVPGYYEHPRPGFVYRPHAWVQLNGRWHLHAGGWVRG